MTAYELRRRATLLVVAALLLLIAALVWLTPAHAAGCQATACKAVPCSTSMSAVDGYQHTPDDAMAPGRDLPEGCDPTATKTP